MSDDPLSSIPSFDRVSIRAVVVSEGEEPGQALSAAGIFDPIAVPVVFGESPGGGGFGDGLTPSVAAVLQPDQQDKRDLTDRQDGVEDDPRAQPTVASRPGAAQQSKPTIASLPRAYGMQPLAPVRHRGG